MLRLFVAAYISLTSIAPLQAQDQITYGRSRAYNTTIHSVVTGSRPKMVLVSASPNGLAKATLSDLVESYEVKHHDDVSAAINGSFYGNAGTVGATIANGKVIQSKVYHRAQVGYANGSLVFGYGLEKSRKDLDWLITGGPYLVRQGHVVATQSFYQEDWSDSTYLRRHPRSAIGKKADGSVVFVVTQGRRRSERGLSLVETAYLMRSYGCIEAINVDGGGSAELIYAHQVKNRPTDGRERAVPNAILILRK